MLQAHEVEDIVARLALRTIERLGLGVIVHALPQVAMLRVEAGEITVWVNAMGAQVLRQLTFEVSSCALIDHRVLS